MAPTDRPVDIGGTAFSRAEVERLVAHASNAAEPRREPVVAVTATGRLNVQRAIDALTTAIGRGQRIYGATNALGDNHDVSVGAAAAAPPDVTANAPWQLHQLIAHDTPGSHERLPAGVVALALAIKANHLATGGLVGATHAIVDAYATAINTRCYTAFVVPRVGPTGIGDLQPNTRMALSVLAPATTDADGIAAAALPIGAGGALALMSGTATSTAILLYAMVLIRRDVLPHLLDGQCATSLFVAHLQRYVAEAEAYALRETASVSGNPIVLDGGAKVLSGCGNWSTVELGLHAERVDAALRQAVLAASHVTRRQAERHPFLVAVRLGSTLGLTIQGGREPCAALSQVSLHSLLDLVATTARDASIGTSSDGDGAMRRVPQLPRLQRARLSALEAATVAPGDANEVAVAFATVDRCFALALGAIGMAVAALRSQAGPFLDEVARTRGQLTQTRGAAALRALWQDESTCAVHDAPPGVQDSTWQRQMPEVAGALLATWNMVRDVLAVATSDRAQRTAHSVAVAAEDCARVMAVVCTAMSEAVFQLTTDKLNGGLQNYLAACAGDTGISQLHATVAALRCEVCAKVTALCTAANAAVHAGAAAAAPARVYVPAVLQIARELRAVAHHARSISWYALCIAHRGMSLREAGSAITTCTADPLAAVPRPQLPRLGPLRRIADRVVGVSGRDADGLRSLWWVYRDPDGAEARTHDDGVYRAVTERIRSVVAWT